MIIAQKNDDLSSCQILDKHGKDYFCNYYCHYNDTGIQVQKYGHPISVSPQKGQKTQSEITTKSTSLLRYSTISKSSTTNIGKNTSTYNINKENIKPPYESSTSPTFKRFSTTSKSSTTSNIEENNYYNINKENKVPPYASFTSSTSSRPSVLSTVSSPSFSRYYLPSKSL